MAKNQKRSPNRKNVKIDWIMNLIIRDKVTKIELQQLAKHFDEEKVLLEDGSKQENLWGGGLDVQTKEIDYNSIINLRPNQENPSRDILSKEIRQKFDNIVKEYLL